MPYRRIPDCKTVQGANINDIQFILSGDIEDDDKYEVQKTLWYIQNRINFDGESHIQINVYDNLILLNIPGKRFRYHMQSDTHWDEIR